MTLFEIERHRGRGGGGGDGDDDDDDDDGDGGGDIFSLQQKRPVIGGGTINEALYEERGTHIFQLIVRACDRSHV